MAGLLAGWLGRRRHEGGTLAVCTNDTSLRYVLASQSNESGATLVSWGTELRGFQTREAFMKRARQVLPRAERVIVVLDPRDYQILQMEAPNVPSDELLGAVRWQAMEFLEGAASDYTLDVLKVAGAGESANKVIAVISRNEVIRTHMRDFEKLDLPISVIDVCETAQRNLLHAVLLAEPGAASGVAAALVADSGRALLVVVVDGQLCFFRRFEFDADMLAVPVDEAQAAMMTQGVGAETATRALNQLNRSLDLWDDSYPHLPLGTLRVEAGARTDAIVERLKSEVGVETRPLALSTIFKLAPGREAPPWTDAGYLPLLGALLRPAG